MSSNGLGQLLNNGMAFDPHASSDRLLLRRILGAMPLWAMWATVKSVDTENWTALVDVLDSKGEYERVVRLTAEGEGSTTAVVQVPKVGSTVIILRIDATDWWAIVQCQQVESVYLMGDTCGTIKAEDLITELKKTNAVVDALVNVLKGVPIVEAGGGTASSLQAALSTALSGLQTGTFNTALVNDKIKHG